MLYENNSLIQKNLTSFYIDPSSDIQIGVYGYVDTDITSLDFKNITESIRELDGDYIIIIKQGSDVKLITQPLLSKNCYYRNQHGLSIALCPYPGWNRVEPNTIYCFQQDDLKSCKILFDWDKTQSKDNFDTLFDVYDKLMVDVPKKQITMSAGKDSGVFGAYCYNNKIDSTYFIHTELENKNILQQRINFFTENSTHFMVEGTKELTLSQEQYLNNPLFDVEKEDLQQLESILENANDGFVLFGLGGDQLYRHRSNNVYPLHLINDLFEQVCINKNIIKINPLMSRRLYQSYVNVKEKHRLRYCWQTQYMHEIKYPYSVDKYSE